MRFKTIESSLITIALEKNVHPFCLSCRLMKPIKEKRFNVIKYRFVFYIDTIISSLGDCLLSLHTYSSLCTKLNQRDAFSIY